MNSNNRNLSIIREYFNSGSAEQEANILTNIFVQKDNFFDIISPQSRTLSLLVGSKGSGKSAILQYWNEICKKSNFPSILLTPILMDVNPVEVDSPLQYSKSIYNALVENIAIKVGSQLGGVLSQDQKTLLDKAISAGERTPTFTNQLLKSLTPIGKAISNVDFDAILSPGSDTIRANIRKLNDYFKNKTESIFYVLFDDIDQFGRASSSTYLEEIWSAILAFRRVVQDLPNVRAIITVRSEIWRQIKLSTKSNRSFDQYDHIRSWVIELQPTESDMSSILRKRLQHCKSLVEKEDGKKYSTEYEPFFEGKMCVLPHSNIERPWESYILKVSRNRPRDTVQLINLLAVDAMKYNSYKIGNRNVEDTSLQYSTERVDDLYKENYDSCPDLKVLVESFAKIDAPNSKDRFEFNAEEVKKHLASVAGNKIYINNKAMQPGNYDDIFTMWDLLYSIGFLNARIADIQTVDGYRHIQVFENPGLVKQSNMNILTAYTWEIHPCYRSYLSDINTRFRNRRLQLQKEKSEMNQTGHQPRGSNQNKTKNRQKNRR